MTAVQDASTTRRFSAQGRRLRRGMVVLAALLGLTSTLPALPAAAAPTNAWASSSAGNGNTRENPGEATITASNAASMAQAWTSTFANNGPGAPTVVGGVVYYLHRFWSTTDPDRLIAASTKTGKTLWQVPISSPDSVFYSDGVTVSGHLALISFQEPRTFGGGLTAVDTTTHKVIWTTTVSNSAADYGWSGHEIYADSTRAYLHLSDTTLAAYRLSDGKLQWTVELPRVTGIGVALGAGILYVGSQDWDGITAYDAATGRQLWTAPGRGTPVVAGGRVFSIRYQALIAVNAAGCGKPTCPALWQKTFPAAVDSDVMLGSADARTVFVTYQKTVPRDQYGISRAGVIVRLSAATGVQQWTASMGFYLGPPARGGSMVWTLTAQMTGAGQEIDHFAGFSATGTDTQPRAVVPAAENGAPQSMAIGGGALFEQTNMPVGLVAYRVPGA